MKIFQIKIMGFKNKNVRFNPGADKRSFSAIFCQKSDLLKIYYLVVIQFTPVKHTVAEKGHLSAQGLNE